MRILAAALLLAAAQTRAAAPITLDDALAEAARTSADLRIARADLAVAGADRTAAVSGVLPRLDLNAAFGHTFLNSTTTSIDPITGLPVLVNGSSDGEAYSAGFQLRQTIFDWATFRDVKAAGWNEHANARLYDEAALAISFEVTRRFYELVRAERSLDVLEKTVARSQELVDRADALFTAGRAPKSETYTARVNLQTDRIAAEQQRIQVEQARTALAQILGRPMAAELKVVPPAVIDAPGLPSGEPPPLDALISQARERRPNLLAQRAFAQSAEASVSAARGGYFPTVAALGTYSRQGTSIFGDTGLYDDPRRNYSASAQVVLTWNLFEGRATSARVARAAGTLERARANADRTETDLAKEVADARSLAVYLVRELGLAQDTLQIAREALALAAQRLDAGLASQLEVRDANLKLTQAELTLLQTRIDHAVAIASLARAVGGAL